MVWTLDESKFLTPQQVKDLRSYLKEKAERGLQRDNLRWMVIDLAMGSGLRCFELADLNVTDCHLDDDQSTIHVVRGKGSRSGNVRLGPTLKQHMLKFLDGRTEGPFLLSERKKMYSRGGLQSLCKRVFKEVGLPKRFSIHSLRHTFCSTLYRKTKCLRTTQQQARHSSPNVTVVYANLLNEDIAKSMTGLYDD